MTIKSDERKIPLEEIVPEYNSKFFLVRKLFFDRIKYAIKLSDIDDNKRILDVGCGSGTLIREIRKTNKKTHITGIDININIKKNSIQNCEFLIENITKLNLKDNSFDIIYALDTLEHVKDIGTAIDEIKRVLKPNGKLIIVGPTENLFYKFCRFLIKGTFSEIEGPCTGIHYHQINRINKIAKSKNLVEEKRISLPRFFPIPLEKVILYSNKK